MKRKGISFTLTLVVLGVVLLMTAFSLVLLGNSALSNTIGQASDSQVESAVQNKCADLGRQIDNRYCDMYTDAGDCQTVQSTRTTTYTTTALDENCDWQANIGQVTNNANGANVLQPMMDENNEPTVTVEGNVYNCVDEGHLNPTCPANN